MATERKQEPTTETTGTTTATEPEAPKEHDPKLKPGQTVQWSSQAGGKVKSKSGKVISFLPANIDINTILSAFSLNPPARRVQGNPTSSKNRYVVAVTADGNDADVNYYAPDALALEKQNK